MFGRFVFAEKVVCGSTFFRQVSRPDFLYLFYISKASKIHAPAINERN